MTHPWRTWQGPQSDTRFCENCRSYRQADGGQVMRTTTGRGRWVCRACLNKAAERMYAAAKPEAA